MLTEENGRGSQGHAHEIQCSIMPKRSFDDLVHLMKTLRGPDGCTWDRKQSLPDLNTFVIEEDYDVLDAIDREDRQSLMEEIGDLLLESVFIAEITREEGSVDIYHSISGGHRRLAPRAS